MLHGNPDGHGRPRTPTAKVRGVQSAAPGSAIAAASTPPLARSPAVIASPCRSANRPTGRLRMPELTPTPAQHPPHCSAGGAAGLGHSTTPSFLRSTNSPAPGGAFGFPSMASHGTPVFGNPPAAHLLTGSTTRSASHCVYTSLNAVDAGGPKVPGILSQSQLQRPLPQPLISRSSGGLVTSAVSNITAASIYSHDAGKIIIDDIDVEAEADVVAAMIAQELHEEEDEDVEYMVPDVEDEDEEVAGSIVKLSQENEAAEGEHPSLSGRQDEVEVVQAHLPSQRSSEHLQPMEGQPIDQDEFLPVTEEAQERPHQTSSQADSVGSWPSQERPTRDDDKQSLQPKEGSGQGSIVAPEPKQQIAQEVVLQSENQPEPDPRFGSEVQHQLINEPSPANKPQEDMNLAHKVEHDPEHNSDLLATFGQNEEEQLISAEAKESLRESLEILVTEAVDTDLVDGQFDEAGIDADIDVDADLMDVYIAEHIEAAAEAAMSPNRSVSSRQASPRQFPPVVPVRGQSASPSLSLAVQEENPGAPEMQPAGEASNFATQMSTDDAIPADARPDSQQLESQSPFLPGKAMAQQSLSQLQPEAIEASPQKMVACVNEIRRTPERPKGTVADSEAPLSPQTQILHKATQSNPSSDVCSIAIGGEWVSELKHIETQCTGALEASASAVRLAVARLSSLFDRAGAAPPAVSDQRLDSNQQLQRYQRLLEQASIDASNWKEREATWQAERASLQNSIKSLTSARQAEAVQTQTTFDPGAGHIDMDVDEERPQDSHGGDPESTAPSVVAYKEYERLVDRVQELEAELKSFEEARSIQPNLSQPSTRAAGDAMHALQTMIKDLNRKIAKQKDELEKLTAQGLTLEEELAASTQALLEEQRKNGDLQQILANQRQSLVEAPHPGRSSASSPLGSEVSGGNHHMITIARAECRRLKEALVKAETDAQRARESRAHALDDLRQSHEVERDRLTGELAAAQEALARRERKLQLRETESDELLRQAKEAQTRRETAIADLQRQLAKREEQISQFAEQSRKQKEHTQELEMMTKKVVAQTEELRREKDSAQEAAHRAISERDALVAKLVEFNQAITMVSQMRTQLEQADKEAKSFSQEKANLDTAKANLEVAKEELEQNLADCKFHLVASEKIAKSLEATNTELGSQLATVKAQLQVAETNASAQRSRQEDLEVTIANVTRERDALKSRVGRAEQALAAFRDQLGQLQSEVQALWSAVEPAVQKPQVISDAPSDQDSAIRHSIEMLQLVADHVRKTRAAEISRSNPLISATREESKPISEAAMAAPIDTTSVRDTESGARKRPRIGTMENVEGQSATSKQGPIIISFSGFNERHPIFNFEKRDKLAKMITALGGKVEVNPDSTRFTHLVTPRTARTLKFYTAILTSRWLIFDPAWIEKSYEAGEFINADTYGVCHAPPMLQEMRIKITSGFRNECGQKNQGSRIKIISDLVKLGGGLLVEGDEMDADMILRAGTESGSGLPWNEFMSVLSGDMKMPTGT